jgi:hypothetical protein
VIHRCQPRGREGAQPTRRELLGRAGALGAGVAGTLAGGLAGGTLARGAAAAPAHHFPSDPQLLAGLLSLEFAVAYAYQSALAARELGACARPLVNELLAHERFHARVLRRALTTLRSVAPAPPRTRAAAERVLARGHVRAQLGQRRGERGWVGLLYDTESLLERNYHTALVELRNPALQELCAEIYASEAQHSALLGELLHPREPALVLPAAFVNGT